MVSALRGERPKPPDERAYIVFIAAPGLEPPNKFLFYFLFKEIIIFVSCFVMLIYELFNKSILYGLNLIWSSVYEMS